MTHETDRMIGRTIGDFHVTRKIGEGGMGAVYLARRTSGFDQTAAIKFLIEGIESAEARARFRLERQVLASLQHPNIVRLLDGGITGDGIPYLAMDYVEGVPIDRYCRENRPPLEARLRLVSKVLAAVDYAHRHLVLHCDLKPGNILVDGGGEPMLLDFGVTKLLGGGAAGLPDAGSGGMAGATRATSRPFTPEYASPEQLRNASLGTATDTYSIAVLLYVLLTGTHPFEGLREHPAALVRASMEHVPEAPSRRAASLRGSDTCLPASLLRGDIDAIVLKGLRKEAESRYRTAAEFAGDLERFLDSQPVSAREGSRRYAFGKFARRYKQFAIAAGLLLLVMTAAGGVTLWQSWRAQRSRAQAQARFDDVRKLTNALLRDYYESLAKLPGSTQAQRALVNWSAEYLDRLGSRSAQSPELRLELAEGYRYIGSLLGDSYANNLGRSKEAVQNIDKGLAVLRGTGALPAREAGLLEARLWAIRGSAHSLDSDTKRALEDCQKAASVIESVAAQYPRDLEVLMTAGSILEQYGDSHGTFTTWYLDIEKTRGLYRRAAEFARQANAAHPGEAAPLRGIALMHAKMGDLVALTDPAAALADFEEAIRGYEALPEEARKNWRNRRSLALAHGRRALAYQNLGDWEKAAEAYRMAVPLLEAAQRIDPANQQAVWDLASVMAEQGEVERERGHKQEAAKLLRRSAAIIEPLVAAKMPGASHSMGQSLARMLRNECAGEPCRAIGERALRLLAEGLDRTDSDQAQWENVADALLWIQPESLRDAARALTLLDRSAKAYTEPPPQHYRIRAEALARLGRAGEAARVAKSGLERLPPLAASGREPILRRRLRELAGGASGAEAGP